MISYRISLMLYVILGFVSFSWASTQDNDIENRFIYSHYSKNISMDLRDVSLVDVLKIFSKKSGMNFISSQDVANKRITLFLENIPVEEALEKILDANDLTYEMAPNSDVFIVKAKSKEQDLITKVFPLKYATVSNSNLKGASGGIKDAVIGSLSKRGKLIEDSRTNSFIITDLPEQFPVIEEALAKLDVPVLQILIEVEMLDVSKGSSDQIGIAYGNQGPLIRVTGGTRTSWLPFNELLVHRKMPTSSTSSTSITTSASGTTKDGVLWTPGTYDFTGMQAALNFLKSEVDTRSLARPRSLTLNNQTAHIAVTTKETTNIDTAQSTSTTATTTSETPHREETGVTLDVTPQANAITGEIQMQVVPEINEAKSTQFTANGSAVFDIEKRTSKSFFKVRTGQTIILGGLLRTQNSNTVDKLPFLGDLPMVGGAFRNKTKRESARELVIFITPYILDEKTKQKLNNGSSHLNREVNEPQRMNTVSSQLDSSEMSNR